MIQLQVLNSILQNKDMKIISDNNLSVDFFSDYTAEYTYIDNHIKTYGNIPDTETFLAAFPKFDIVKVSETNDYLIKELYRDKNSRVIAKTFNQIRELLLADKTDEAMQLYMSSTQDISDSNPMNCIDILHDNSRYDAYIERSKDYMKYYIKTGFAELDEILGGWDREEDLVTIVSRNGMGKSWIGLKIAIAAAQQGLTVGLYSGEMSARMVGYRADSLISHISNAQLIHGNLNVQNDYKRYIDADLNKITGKLLVLTPDMVGGSVSVSTLRAFIEKEHLDMLCVDQHSLLEDDRKAKNPVDRASNISKDLKGLQSLKRIPIIAISQQNRSSTENGLNTTLIAQSDRIGQDSTLVLFLEQKDGILTLNIVKSRFSASNKKLQYAIDFDKGMFTYIPSNEEKTDKTLDDYQPDEVEQNTDVEVF